MRRRTWLVTAGLVPSYRVLLAKHKVTIGADSSNDMVLSDPQVSRKHALIRRRSGRYLLTDLDSTNGTFVNGRRVIGTVAIRPGDDIRFSQTRMLIETAALPERGLRFSVLGPILGIALSFFVGFLSVRFAENSRLQGVGRQRSETVTTAPLRLKPSTCFRRQSFPYFNGARAEKTWDS
jgi:hypothetical protein